MEIISKVHEYCLRAAAAHKDIQFKIPSIWYRRFGDAASCAPSKEQAINPYEHTANILEYLLAADAPNLDMPINLDNSVIYTTLVRYSAAWNYDGSGDWQSGTFLRMLWLLPMLQDMGVNILYLLPVTRNSELNRKGDLGSPYAIADYFSLDPALHDPLLDGLTDLSLDDELALLIAGCHRLGIRVVHDFIPRVTAMNNELVKQHPDWIYWIRRETLPGFAPPEVPGLDPFTECTPDRLASLYQAPATAGHLAKFSLAPNQLDPDLWQRLQAQAEADGSELITLVEEQMGIVPAPAHSDWINDVQPVWTDIAFLRLYLDVHPAARPYLPAGQPPYVLFDTIKCNRFPGEEPNAPLWQWLEDAVAHQMQRYGFDGFRIDIGHTLPPSLLQRLIDRMHEGCAHPLIISEDLFNRNHEQARATGYNIMLGSGWNVMADATHERLFTYLRELADLKIHVFACTETPDTPRITSRPGGKALARALTLFNGFLPNGIPFINTGLEVNELQPLNCGLADNTDGADIPRAFFNRMQIAWQDNHDMHALLCHIAQLRARFAALLSPQHFVLLAAPAPVLLFGYRQQNQSLMLAINLDPLQAQPLDWARLSPELGADAERLLDSHQGIQPATTGRPSQLAPLQAVLLWQA